jgi:hypothetical protein
MNFKKINNIAGWAVFAIATITYTLTVEGTASFWDCGEFIAAAYKLQVPHPPGAPFFLLVGRMFSMLATDKTMVAFWVNMSSVLASGLTIMLLFWSITLIARKFIRVPKSGGIVIDKEETMTKPTSDYSTAELIKVIGAGLVGSLAYTFSDSFWFSAVESEVYAMSSFFTAFVYWAMLKWDAADETVDSDKWILLICYTVGLSIGVHLLNLVTIPALALIFYFKKYKPSLGQGILAFVIGVVLVLLISEGVIPQLPTIAGKFEVFFRNSIGLPFNYGIVIFIILIVGLLIFGIYSSQKKANRLFNTIMIGLTMFLIGYASYALILIRSNFNPPLDENNPENIISFVSYLKREQYGDRPLFYGSQHTGRIIGEEDGAPMYRKEGDKYVVFDHKKKYKYEEQHLTFIPRLHSNQDDHVARYRDWVGDPKKSIGTDENGREAYTYSFGQNLKFMFTYQFGYQYFRYFMWNFAGREYDMQGSSWLTPLSSDKNLPEFIVKNKGRNNYFFLPLIIGLLGFVYHIIEANKKKDGYTLFPLIAFFVLTGLALAFYLNQPPVEPRERDYIYVGSYYVFCIWIGIGVFGIIDALSGFIKSEKLASALAVAICLTVPSIMLAKNYDDHDRSGRFHSVDSAKNLLNSCAPNAVLFTGGDNDTFPLWYVQDVEGFRTDVRVCNLSLLSTDWYVDQMKLKAYESQPLPISWENSVYIQGRNDYLPFRENPSMKGGISLRQFVKAVEASADPAKATTSPLFDKDYQRTVLPSSIFGLDIDTAAVNALGIIPANVKNRLVTEMVWKVGNRALMKADLVILNMIVTNNWKRPIYFSTTLSRENYLGLQEYLQQEGLAYRLLPVRTPGEDQGRVDTDIMYDNMMHKFLFRGLNDPTRYYDENYLRFPLNVRTNFAKLAETLYMEGKKDKAKEVVDYCLKVMPDNAIPYDVYSPRFGVIYAKLGETNKALQLARTIAPRAVAGAKYYSTYDPTNYDLRTNLYMLGQCIEIFNEAKSPDEAKKYEAEYNIFAQSIQQGN